MKSSKSPVDLKQSATWTRIAEEFYNGASNALSKLAKSKKPHVPSLTFWIHLDYMPVCIYTDAKFEGDGVGRFVIPTLEKEYEHGDETGKRSLTYPKLKVAIHKSFAKSILKLKKDGVFDPFCADHLAIFCHTEDSDAALVTTLGDVKAVPYLFQEKPLVELSQSKNSKPSKGWWFASAVGPNITVRVSEKFDKIEITGRTLKEWVHTGRRDVWSYRLIGVLRQLGIKELTVSPMAASQLALKQASKSFYASATLDEVRTDVFLAEADDERKRDYGADKSDVSRLRFGKTLAAERKPKAFRIDGWSRGIVVSDDVKRAIEANGISGILFSEIKPQKSELQIKDLEALVKSGDEDAAWRLGVEFLHGRLVRVDVKRALELFERVIDSDDLDAIEKLRAVDLKKFGDNCGIAEVVKGLALLKNHELYEGSRAIQRAKALGAPNIKAYQKKFDDVEAAMKEAQANAADLSDKPPNALTNAITDRVSDAEFAKILKASKHLVNEMEASGFMPINTAVMYSAADGLGKVKALVAAGADLKASGAKAHAKALGSPFSAAYEYLKKL